MRRLQSKALRYALLSATDGRCAHCNTELVDGWHADHVIPWSKTHETNVHDMQALCPTCNLKKGTMNFRKHQSAMNTICNRLLEGDTRRKIIASVTPGGGKSVLPQILAKRLIPKIADKICWVVPRLTLQNQAAKCFLDHSDRALVGHSLEIRESTNQKDPSRTFNGFTTTYNAIGVAAGTTLNSDEFKKHRYILVLDEPQHVEDGGSWHRALQPLVDRCALLVLMSGTLDRNDRKPVAFVPYKSGEKTLVADDSESDAVASVRYGLRDALKEKAVIPLMFTRIDCRAEWIDEAGTNRKIESLADAGDDTSSALYTALRTEYADELLARCVAHWRIFKRNNPRSKMLVVCSSIARAKPMLAKLVADGIRAEIATSDDSESAQRTIKAFRSSDDVDALVTVQMAYEGMDVPAVTHIACLTHIRSRPWIEQMLARATRFDKLAGKYETQFAHAFVPDDALMGDVIRDIEEAQLLEIREERPNNGADGTAPTPTSIVPLSSQVTREREGQLTDGGMMSYEETARMRDWLQAIGFPWMGAAWAKSAEKELERVKSQSYATTAAPAQTLTAREREDALRKEIDTLSGMVDGSLFNREWGETNARLVKHFRGRRRKEMTERELTEAKELLGQVLAGKVELRG